MNKSIRLSPVLFLLLTSYILSSCKTTVFVQNAPTPAPTGTVDPLASPSPDLSATPQVTGIPTEDDDDDDEFGNVTGIVGLVTIEGDHITIYITLDDGTFIVREAERPDHSEGGSGHDDDDSD